MLKWLLMLEWKRSLRSSMWQRNVFLNIFLGLFLVYMLLIALMLGFFLDRMIGEGLEIEGVEVIRVFGSGMFYYIGLDLFWRFFIQQVPESSARPLLHLPVNKRRLAGFTLLRTLFSPLNLLPLLIVVPFFANTYADFPDGTAWPWLISILSVVVANNFITFLLKRFLADKTWVLFVLLVVVVALGFLEKSGLISLLSASGWLFGLLLENPLTAVVFVVLPVAFYYVNVNMVVRHLYLEDIDRRKTYQVDAGKMENLRRFGKVGELILLELKLMTRNKRTRTVLYMAPFLLLYGFFFYPNPMYNDKIGWLLFAGLFVTGGFLISYGQFLVAWESSYFDTILTKNVNYSQYFYAKYLILLLPTVAAWLLSIPYLWFGVHILKINTAAFLFNAGFNIYVYMYFAAYNNKRIDLSRGAVMNYQGVGAKQFLVAAPVLLLPALIYLPFGVFVGQDAGLVVIGGIGLLGLLLRKFILRQIEKAFVKRKYQLAEGFRQN